jgi:hypothetical protein
MDDEQALSEVADLEESPTSEQVELPDDSDDADPGEAEEAEEGADDSEADQPDDKPHSRRDKRIQAVLDERAEVLKAAEEAGLVWDKDAKRFLPKDDAQQQDAGDGEDAFAWQPPAEEADASEVYTEGFWQQKPEAMAANATWRQVAESYGFDPDEAVANEWAAIKQFYNRDLSAWEQGKEARAHTEAEAAKRIDAELKGLKSDPDFSLSEKAQRFVTSEVARFKGEGRTPSEIAAILPNIRAKAYYEHRAEFTTAAQSKAAQRAVKEAEGRKVLLGGQGGQAEGSGGPTVSLTPAQMKAAQGMKMTPAEYAKFLGED